METPIHIKNGVAQAPPDDVHFIVAGNGTFVRKRNNWVDAIVPVKAIDGLEKQESSATLLLPRMKSTVFAKAVRFFHAVYKKQQTEAAVLLHYSPQLGWELSVPEQEATGTQVIYGAGERLPGYRCVGTMHSHCAMSAFHSGIDTRDEAEQDGIHITIGLLNRFPRFGMDAEVVVNGARFPMSHEHVIYLEKEAGTLKPESKFEWSNSNGNQLYRFRFSVLRDWSVPKEWINRVKVVEYGRSFRYTAGREPQVATTGLISDKITLVGNSGKEEK